MIAKTAARRLSGRTRSAFTLLEVLVVVAILVVLAGVSSMYVFKYLEDAKKDKAVLDMKTLESVFKNYSVKNGGQGPSAITDLVPYLEQGQNGLVNPWGRPYQYRVIQAEVGERVQFYTIADDGQELVWPRQ